MYRRNLFEEYNYDIYNSITFNPGDHICALYDKDEDAIDILARYFK